MGHVFAHRARRMVALAVMLVLAFAASSATVALGDPAPVTYYACLSPIGGTLYQVNTMGPHTCVIKGAQQVSWGQAGPAGQNGASKGYAAVSKVPPALSSTDTAMVTLSNLPAGNYIVNAADSSSVQAPPGSSGSGLLECHLNAGGQANSQQGVDGGLFATSQKMHVSVTDAISLSSPGDISLTCKGSGYDLTSLNASITAMQVDTIN